MEGRGIGTALVARASEMLRDRGPGACHIGWTVRESFCTRAGYRRRAAHVLIPAAGRAIASWLPSVAEAPAE